MTLFQPGQLIERSTRMGVTVTFLQQGQRPTGPRLPADVELVRLGRPTVGFYRYLYNSVGGPYVWWLRRTLSDAELGAIIHDPMLSVHVLYRDGEPAGYFEIDRKPARGTNIAYFGLMPHAVGLGLGAAFLQAACEAAWEGAPRSVTVNTCTADHPRALPGYLRAGFRIIREEREVWDVPDALGLTIPHALRVA